MRYQKRIGVEERVREPKQKSMTASFRLPTPTTSTGSGGRGEPSAAVAARTPDTRRQLRLRGDEARRRADAQEEASGGECGRPRTEAAMDNDQGCVGGGGF